MLERKQWRDLTMGQRLAVQLAVALQFSLLAAALWDIWHRPVDEINGDRRLWTLASFVNFVGPLSYFLVGRRDCC